MKITLLIFTALFFAGCFTTQDLSSKYREFYRGRAYPGNVIVHAGPIFTVERTPEGTYIYKQYFFETGKKVEETVYADAKLTAKHGPSTMWSDQGVMYQQENYDRGKKEGLCSYYQPLDGSPQSKGVYRKDKKEGVWEYYNLKGEKYRETPYENDLRHGWSRIYGPNGMIKDSVEYRHDVSMRADTLQVLEIPPQFQCDPKFASADEKCGERSLMIFLSNNIRYPGDAREKEITGKSYSTFVVDKNGAVTDVVVYRGVCNSIKQECIRVIKAMPQWTPGSHNGTPVKVRYTLPITFRLE